MNVVLQKGVHVGDLYHDLLKMSWMGFVTLFTAFLFFIHALFGLIFFFIPLEQFEGFHFNSGWDHFLECFFFSVQTFGTIGYGKVSPIGVSANGVVTLESFCSLFLVAVLTGLIFARFAKPHSKVLFSHHAVIKKFDEIPCLMFRLANARQNYITDARVRVTLAIDNPKTRFRDFIDLKLERESSPIFSLSWTIAHDLDQTSPLYGLSEEDWRKRNVELVVTFSGTDTTLSQNVHSKTSYIWSEILHEHDFVDVIKRNANGTVELQIEKLNLVKSLLTSEAYSNAKIDA